MVGGAGSAEHGGMNLLRHLLKPAPRPASPDVQAPPEADDPAAPCGWFDSSHDLRRGLDVVELAWHDTLPVAWPLDAMSSSAQPA
jgi:hypothetical protein